MGPTPISVISIYKLCREMDENPDEVIPVILVLDDLWLQWYAQEEENKRELASGKS